MSAVTNTGPLIVLAKLNRLHLLPVLYGEVVVPQAVYQESVVVGTVYYFPTTEAAYLKRLALAHGPESREQRKDSLLSQPACYESIDAGRRVYSRLDRSQWH